MGYYIDTGAKAGRKMGARQSLVVAEPNCRAPNCRAPNCRAPNCRSAELSRRRIVRAELSRAELSAPNCRGPEVLSSNVYFLSNTLLYVCGLVRALVRECSPFVEEFVG